MNDSDTRSPFLIAWLRDLYTPVVADVLDRLGYRSETMRPEIRPPSVVEPRIETLSLEEIYIGNMRARRPALTQSLAAHAA